MGDKDGEIRDKINKDGRKETKEMKRKMWWYERGDDNGGRKEEWNRCKLGEKKGKEKGSKNRKERKWWKRKICW